MTRPTTCHRILKFLNEVSENAEDYRVRTEDDPIITALRAIFAGEMPRYKEHAEEISRVTTEQIHEVFDSLEELEKLGAVLRTEERVSRPTLPPGPGSVFTKSTSYWQITDVGKKLLAELNPTHV